MHKTFKCKDYDATVDITNEETFWCRRCKRRLSLVLLVSYQMTMDRKTMSYAERYSERIEQLENEIKEKQEELEYSNQSTIDILEEEIYNTKQSIKELKKYD